MSFSVRLVFSGFQPGESFSFHQGPSEREDQRDSGLAGPPGSPPFFLGLQIHGVLGGNDPYLVRKFSRDSVFFFVRKIYLFMFVGCYIFIYTIVLLIISV